MFWEEEEGEEGIQLVELRKEGPGNMEEDWPSHITGRDTTTPGIGPKFITTCQGSLS